MAARRTRVSRRNPYKAGIAFAFRVRVVPRTSMNISNRFNSTSALRGGSYLVLASLMVPLAGCGSPAPPPAPTTISRAPMSVPNANRPSMGLSGKQKVVLLAGAAALYYYYQKSKKATEAKYPGQQVQYYRSKNGRIYYRNPKTHEAIYVTAPNASYQPSISAAEAQSYPGLEKAQGYAGAQTGNNLDYYFPAAPGAGA